jgi:hypothetical protein
VLLRCGGVLGSKVPSFTSLAPSLGTDEVGRGECLRTCAVDPARRALAGLRVKILASALSFVKASAAWLLFVFVRLLGKRPIASPARQFPLLGVPQLSARGHCASFAAFCAPFARLLRCVRPVTPPKRPSPEEGRKGRSKGEVDGGGQARSIKPALLAECPFPQERGGHSRGRRPFPLVWIHISSVRKRRTPSRARKTGTGITLAQHGQA